MVKKLSPLLKKGQPLQILGVPNALLGKMAEEAGFQALYLSGAALSAGAFALPDLGLLSFETLLEEGRRISAASSLPLLLDIDTGWDNLLFLERAGRRFLEEGIAALQMEDQAGVKRCGHREGISLIPPEEMGEKIQALKKSSIEIVVRTDALSIEGLQKTIERCHLYVEAGADLLFVEAVSSLEEVKALKEALKKPLLINLTEFGKTPLFTLQEMQALQVDALLYPVTLSRVLWGAGKEFLKAFKKEGSQRFALDTMMNRQELYRILDYERFEKKSDRRTP